MPTYDYQCRSCGTVTEVIHPMSEDGPSVCDQCGGALRRVLFPAGIIFKGSGFYRTDSRASSPSTNSGSSSGSTSGSGSATATSPSTSPDGGGAAASTPETKGTTSESTSSSGSPSSD